METFPSILPGCTRDFSFKPRPAVIQTKMDAGNVRKRKRFSTQFSEVSVKWNFTDQELAIFRAWVSYKLNDGADSFTLSIPMGNGFQTQTVSFNEGAYSVGAKLVLHWQVTATLICESVPPLTEAELDAYL